MLGGEPWAHQRTLDELGLDGMTTDDIRSLVEGEVPVAVERPLLPSRRYSGTFAGR